MTNRKTIAIALAVPLGVAALGAGAYAASETITDRDELAEMRFGLDGTFISSNATDDEDRDEYAAFRGAKLTLSDALAKAVADTDVTAFEAEYDEEDGRVVIEVETAKGDQLTEMEIDANTGAILEKGLDDDDRDHEGERS